MDFTEGCSDYDVRLNPGRPNSQGKVATTEALIERNRKERERLREQRKRNGSNKPKAVDGEGYVEPKQAPAENVAVPKKPRPWSPSQKADPFKRCRKMGTKTAPDVHKGEIARASQGSRGSLEFGRPDENRAAFNRRVNALIFEARKHPSLNCLEHNTPLIELVTLLTSEPIDGDCIFVDVEDVRELAFPRQPRKRRRKRHKKRGGNKAKPRLGTHDIAIAGY